MNHEQIAASLRATARELELSEARTDGVEHMNEVLSKANNNLAAQVESLKEVNGMVETDRAVLQDKLDVSVQVANSLKARVEELESYAHETASTIDHLRAARDAALRGYSEQMDRANQAQAALEDARDRENKATCGVAAYADSIDRMQQSLDNHVLILDQKCKRIEELEGCLMHMRAEHVRLIKELNAAYQKAEDMEGNWRLCIDACDLLKQRIYPQEKQNYILKTNAQAAQNQVRDLQTAIEGKELALAAQVAENSRLIGVITRLRQKLSDYWVADLEDQKLATPGQAAFLAGLIKQTEGQ